MAKQYYWKSRLRIIWNAARHDDVDAPTGDPDAAHDDQERDGRPDGEQLGEAEEASEGDEADGADADQQALPSRPHRQAERGRGTGTESSTSSRIALDEMPWRSASGVTRRRCASTGSASCLTSSGVT